MNTIPSEGPFGVIPGFVNWIWNVVVNPPASDKNGGALFPFEVPAGFVYQALPSWFARLGVSCRKFDVPFVTIVALPFVCSPPALVVGKGGYVKGVCA